MKINGYIRRITNDCLNELKFLYSTNPDKFSNNGIKILMEYTDNVEIFKQYLSEKENRIYSELIENSTKSLHIFYGKYKKLLKETEVITCIVCGVKLLPDEKKFSDGFGNFYCKECWHQFDE